MRRSTLNESLLCQTTHRTALLLNPQSFRGPEKCFERDIRHFINVFHLSLVFSSPNPRQVATNTLFQNSALLPVLILFTLKISCFSSSNII